jgi:hypothetical protein
MGARDTSPRGGKPYYCLKSLAEDYDATEYLITTPEQVFGGNAVQLMQAMYKCEQIPVRVRLYAAGKAAEFELPRGVGFQETGGANDAEDYREKLVAAIERLRDEMAPSEIVRHNLEDLLITRCGGVNNEDREFLDNVCRLIDERFPAERHASEILLPPQPRPAFRRSSR